MVACIVLFGGQGNRFEHFEPKQYFEILGKSLLVHCIESLKTIKQLSQLVIVCHPNERKRVKKMLTKIEAFESQIEMVYCDSGSQRSDSVFNGLKACKPNTKYVLIHDGARAFCPPILFKNLSKNLLKLGGGVVPALPLVDTIVKLSDDQESRIQRSLKRDKLRKVQTPQGFEYQLILKAYCIGRNTSFEGTDCSSYFLNAGYKVRIIQGSEENIKVTTPIDIEIAKHILRIRNHLKC